MTATTFDAKCAAPAWSGERQAALDRLQSFAHRAGRAYAAKRNYDFGHIQQHAVSQLSPWVRHRVLSEAEIVHRVLADHTLANAEKFIQEVCWRTYWKGWLEQRPGVWTDYLSALAIRMADADRHRALNRRLTDACAGQTGIACFDHWARELTETGYLHNHARMWFASIWIFTLKLPWELGADFFMRHLLDGDPASNTLSWRWVAGLQTVGKTYLARADNIETFTAGRFRPQPHELAEVAEPVAERGPAPPRIALRKSHPPQAGDGTVLLISEDDVSADQWPLDGIRVTGIAVACVPTSAPYAPSVIAFKRDVLAAAGRHLHSTFATQVIDVADAATLVAFAKDRGATQIVSHYRPCGFATTEIDRWVEECRGAGLQVHEAHRAWDEAFWPYAKAGFFQLKDKIPAVLMQLGLARC